MKGSSNVKGGGSGPTPPVPSDISNIGGKIFYVDSSITDCDIKFWDANYNELTNYSVEGLLNARYYRIDEYSLTGDKYYIVATEDGTEQTNLSYQSGIEWGAYNTEIGTGTLVGTGKSNTKKALSNSASFVDSAGGNNTIWNYIKIKNDMEFSGHNDWYIGSILEVREFVNSVIEQSITRTENHFITSTEGDNAGYSKTTIYKCEKYRNTVDAYYKNTSSTDRIVYPTRSFGKGPTPATGIYGVNWLGTSDSSMTRTDDAVDFADPVPYVNNGMTGADCSSPFDNIMPWSGMTRVTDSEAGELVKIPKYWYKWTRVSDTMKLQITGDESVAQANNFYVSPAHADRGDGVGERDEVYVGRYHCSTSNYKSATGVKPKVSITRATARSNISNLGNSIWQLDYAMFWTVNMLYLVEFANWDSQAMIGYGCGNGSASENSGKTDSMPYHTGTMQSAKTTYGTGVQYRYIEDWWANVYDCVDGIRFSNTTVYGYNNPSSFSDTSGGTNVGTRANSSGYIKSYTNPTATGYEYFLYPNIVASSIGYVRDYCDFGSGDVVLRFGGDFYDQDGSRGAFFFHDGTTSGSDSHIGCRLQKLGGIDDLTGTSWYFNESLNYPSSGKEFYIQFISDNMQFSRFAMSNIALLYDSVPVRNATGWQKSEYRTINITGGSDATNTTLIQWILQNATRLS